MATQQQTDAYIGAIVDAALANSLVPADLAAIVIIGGLTTQISKLEAQAQNIQAASDADVAEKQAAIAAINEAKAAIQAQLRALSGS